MPCTSGSTRCASTLNSGKDAAFSSDGTPAGRFTRDARQYRYAEEVAALSAAEDKLCFGRLDTDDGESRHIGRMGLTDGTGATPDPDRLASAGRGAVLHGDRAQSPGVSLRRHIRNVGARWSRCRTNTCRRPTPCRKGDLGPPAIRAAGGPERPANRPDVGHHRHHPGRAGPDHPVGPPGSWSCRAGPGRARPRSPCTGRPTCSTPSGPGSAATACWSSGRTRRSLTYIPSGAAVAGRDRRWCS